LMVLRAPGNLEVIESAGDAAAIADACGLLLLPLDKIADTPEARCDTAGDVVGHHGRLGKSEMIALKPAIEGACTDAVPALYSARLDQAIKIRVGIVRRLSGILLNVCCHRSLSRRASTRRSHRRDAFAAHRKVDEGETNPVRHRSK